jgi:hypothetical protein
MSAKRKVLRSMWKANKDPLILGKRTFNNWCNRVVDLNMARAKDKAEREKAEAQTRYLEMEASLKQLEATQKAFDALPKEEQEHLMRTEMYEKGYTYPTAPVFAEECKSVDPATNFYDEAAKLTPEERIELCSVPVTANSPIFIGSPCCPDKGFGTSCEPV